MNRKYFDRDISQLKRTPFEIFTNQAGYTRNSRKTAVMPFACEDFTVNDTDGNIRFRGKTKRFGFDESSGDDVYTADFSSFCEEGVYRVYSGEKRSALFRINDRVYDKVLYDTSKAFYYLRCGCALTEGYAGEYVHAPCHTSQAVLWEDNSVFLDVSGGWHDAGDYGRYVTAGACAVAHLLYAYISYPEVFDKLKLSIPEEGMPDILAEVKYELEWLMKMQRGDGAAYHKVTTMLHAPFVMPENDTAPLVVFPISSMATADLAAVTALAAGVYKKYDPEFAGRLSAAAHKSADWLDAHSEFVGFRNPEGNNTGGYYEWDDNSNRYWAYAEMYSLTGEKKYHDKLSVLMELGFPLTEFGYMEVGGLGSLAYLMTDREQDEDISRRLRAEFSSRAEELKALSDGCGYGVAMSKNDYHWGSNMSVMKKGMVFAVNERFNSDSDSRDYARRQVDYLLGTNALGISYITGTGEFRSNHPHLRPAFADGIEECMPGMVIGGPNGKPADPYAEQVIKEGTPPMKCYADDAASYSLNEITIYWNSPTVFVLSYLCADQ